MDTKHLDRRRFLARAAAGATTLLLGACDKLSESSWFPRILGGAEGVTRRVQRAITGSHALAREFTEADLSPEFKSNGTQEPDDPDYQKLAENGFKDWRLEVAGLVERPAKLLAGRAARAAVAHADHAARLRRGLELHRQMERRAALDRARPRRRRPRRATSCSSAPIR